MKAAKSRRQKAYDRGEEEEEEMEKARSTSKVRDRHTSWILDKLTIIEGNSHTTIYNI